VENLENKRFHCIIFDCDGVLVDSEIIASRVSLKMLKPFGFDMDPREYAKIFAGKVEEDILSIIKQDYKIELPEDFISRLRLEIEHDLDHELQPIKGAREIISRLKLKKAVVSNSRLVRVLRSLAVAELKEDFDRKIFSVEMVKRPKPFPDIYLHAAKELNVEPHHCLVVEDSKSGATSARNAGMNVIGFLGASHIPEGHDVTLKEVGAFATVNNMEELDTLLKELIS
jgi:HAD superfamily hydrolase (TIGR01509 family)